MATTTYPPSPSDRPRGLTALTATYQMRAALAVLAILLFFVLYFALVIALGALVKLAIFYPIISINKFTILGKLGAIAGSAMLFVFTLKFLFKLKNHVPENRLTLDPSQQPGIFGFVDRICAETRAPRPRRIHVDPDVNAYVAYTNTWLSLLFPVKKDLTIGLGLVSILDRSEFKAVTAHEFGHFAQRSMRIGSYIVSANTIIHDMIYQRDKWDEALEQWRGADLRLSFAAWIITPIIWLIRKTLGLFYSLLNLLHSSLSREMEFNADKVAVSATGSEAIISALWKLDDGERHWRTTLNNAYLAAQKGIHVKDLYAHNDLAIERGGVELQSKAAALPEDPRGGRRFFATASRSNVGMYASHPSNDMREDNAKRPFVACERDLDPAWSLFDDRTGLCLAMTDLVYSKYLGKKPTSFVSEEVFERFVLAETAGTELLDEHHNTFSARFLQIPEQEELVKAVAAFQAEPVENTILLKEQLGTLMEPIKQIEELMTLAQGMAQGTAGERSFSFQGKNFDKRTLQAGWEALSAERERLFNGDLKRWDAEFCATHLKLAEIRGVRNELQQRYDQHRALTDMYKRIAHVRSFALQEVQRLQAMEQVATETIRGVVRDINARVAEANDKLNCLRQMPLCAMPNVETTDELLEAITPGGTFKEGSLFMFENKDFGRLMDDLERALGHCQRLDTKSIASILAEHKKLVEPFGMCSEQAALNT